MTRSVFFLLGIALLAMACKKEYTIHAETQGTYEYAYLKVVHAAPFFRTTTGSQDTFNIYIGGKKVNGSALTYNSIFPVAGTNGYLAVEPGTQEIKLTIPGALTGDSVTILKLSKNFVASKYYTFMITDSIQTASRDTTRIFVEDVFGKPSPGFISLRFIHAVLNDTATKTVDLFSYAKGATILNKIAPDSVCAFTTLGYNVQTPDTFYVTRSAASGTPLASRIVLAKLAFNTTTIVGLAQQRSYTLYFKGDGTTATGNKPRSLTGYVH